MKQYYPSHRSPAQIEATRENSRYSTGPRTEAGKAASSANSYKHGFTAILSTGLTPHSASVLSEVHHEYQREFRPIGILECDLLRRIADESFRLRQIDIGIEDLKLEAMRTVRETETPRGDGSKDAQFIRATADPAFQRRFALLLRYKSAAERAYYRALATLRQIQKERRAESEAAHQIEQKKPQTKVRDFVSQPPEDQIVPTADPRETPPEEGRE